jgi:hypothetical protein
LLSHVINRIITWRGGVSQRPASRSLSRHQSADHGRKVALGAKRRPAADRIWSRASRRALVVFGLGLRTLAAQLLHAGTDHGKIVGSAGARGLGEHRLKTRQAGGTATDWKIMVNGASAVILPRSRCPRLIGRLVSPIRPVIPRASWNGSSAEARRCHRGRRLPPIRKVLPRRACSGRRLRCGQLSRFEPRGQPQLFSKRSTLFQIWPTGARL